MTITRTFNTWPHDYVRVFERNCPGARLNKDERAELERLFKVMRDTVRKEEQAP